MTGKSRDFCRLRSDGILGCLYSQEISKMDRSPHGPEPHKLSILTPHSRVRRANASSLIVSVHSHAVFTSILQSQDTSQVVHSDTLVRFGRRENYHTSDKAYLSQPPTITSPTILPPLPTLVFSYPRTANTMRASTILASFAAMLTLAVADDVSFATYTNGDCSQGQTDIHALRGECQHLPGKGFKLWWKLQESCQGELFPSCNTASPTTSTLNHHKRMKLVLLITFP